MQEDSPKLKLIDFTAQHWTNDTDSQTKNPEDDHEFLTTVRNFYVDISAELNRIFNIQMPDFNKQMFRWVKIFTKQPKAQASSNPETGANRNWVHFQAPN